MSDTPYQPLKGDPTVLAAKAQHYQDIADAIKRSVTTLKKIHDVDDMKSKATEKLKDSSKDVADDIEKAHDRYEKTAQALLTYAGKLQDAQDAANTAISHISDKQDAADAAHRAARTAQQTADDATDADKSTADADAATAKTDATDADHALAAAHKEWHDALDTKNTAADAAVKAIVDVVEHHNNGLKDSWWDDWGSSVYEAFKTICKWAGVLSIFLGWVPILGQILIVLATIGAVLDLIDSVIKAITEGGSWLDVLVAAGGVALSFVGGSAFAQLTKNLKAVSLMRSLPKVVSDARAMKSMRSILKLKNGESMVPTAFAASKTMRMGFKDTVKAMFKSSFKELVPEVKLTANSTFKDVIKVAKDQKILPSLENLKNVFNPAKILKLNGELVDTVKMIGMNPALLKDPQIAVPLIGAGAYQVEQSIKAYNDFDPSKPSNYLNETVYNLK
jgi:hypothetical protein